jgi:hypothetical protein
VGECVFGKRGLLTCWEQQWQVHPLVHVHAAADCWCLCGVVKEHPIASSKGIVVGAGPLLGPDLLAGTAVAGKECAYGGGATQWAWVWGRGN